MEGDVVFLHCVFERRMKLETRISKQLEMRRIRRAEEVGGWVDGWVGGWVGGRRRLRLQDEAIMRYGSLFSRESQWPRCQRVDDG
jgi:hypothetical protein